MIRLHLRHRTPTLAALLVTGAAAIAAAGCGSSDDSSTTTGPTAADAQDAYAATKSKLSNLGSRIGAALSGASGQSVDQLESQFSDLQQQAQQQVDAIRDLDVPGQLADERDALSDAVDKGKDDIRELVAAVRDKDAAAARTAAQNLVTDSATIKSARQKFESALSSATR
jgi:hypothetical protein